MRFPLVSVPARTAVWSLGSTPSSTTPPLLRFANALTIPSDGEYGLAIVGEGEGRRRLTQALLSKHRFHPQPPAPGIFPYTYHWAQQTKLTDTTAPERPPAIRHLTFSKPSPTGEFTDYTARYGALQEEDKDTLLQFFQESLYPAPTDEAIAAVASILGIQHLLQLPLVALSSGQTRRSRIAAGLLAQPRMLILEDPFAGLDVQSRQQIADMLGAVNSGSQTLGGMSRGEGDAMRLVLSLRGTSAVGMPEYVSHVARVAGGEVETLEKEEYVEKLKSEGGKQHVVPEIHASHEHRAGHDAPVADAQNVSIAYGEKKILDDVSWRILPGDRWHLQGSNGSGKTTLLSLILGHHPRSFSLPAERLTLFSKPRRSVATPTLRRLIGHASPEIFAAFPRGMGLSAGEVVGTGYEGVFARRRMTAEQRERIMQLLEPFKDLLAVRSRTRTADVTVGTERIYETDFSHFPPSQQALLLFLRAIVARPALLILDEASQGMDEESWARCRALLEKEWDGMARGKGQQAVVVVSHWEEEASLCVLEAPSMLTDLLQVPWEVGQGQVLRLHDGKVVEET